MARSKTTPRLDVSRLLKHLGGGPAIRRKVAILGFTEPPTEAQMRKWVQRRMIPGDWLVFLIQQAKLEKRPLDVTDFIIEG